MGRNSQARTLVPNLTIVTFKMWVYTPKIAEIGNFWYKFAHKGYTPLSDFLIKFGLGQGVPGPHPHTKFHRFRFINVGLQPQNREKSHFSYKFALRKNFGGSAEKVEYRCTTTSLPVSNDAITNNLSFFHFRFIVYLVYDFIINI